LLRTSRSRNRPLLFAEDPRGKLEELMVVRGPLYQSIAMVTVSTDGRKVAAVAAEIADRLRERGLNC
jgi:shikimate kinase